MPPVGGPQGSRTALITWSVVFAFLFVLSSVFAIYFYADSTKARQSEEQTKKQYTEMAAPGELQGDAVTRLREVKQNPREGSAVTPAMPLFTVAVTEGQELSQLIGGPSASNPKANSRNARARFAPKPRAFRRPIFSGRSYSGP